MPNATFALRGLYGLLAIATLALQPAARAERFGFIAIGDMPYNLPGDYAAFDRVIARINTLQPAFTIHVGDIINGQTRCDDALFLRVRDMFATFNGPLVYTPGDNEWTDCHRADNGGYDPVERLAKVRGLFFTDPARSLGREKIALEHQGTDARHSTYIENQRWEKSGIIFATLHIIGSNNNLQRDQAAVNEYIARNAANLAWMQAAFARATERNARAVVLAFQADPGWEFDGREDQRSGFTDTLNALRLHARAFGKPVLIVHGDKHRFIVDKPLYQNRQLIYNVTRMMVFGDNEVQGTMVTVDTDDPDVFSFRTLTVPENIPAAKPAPKP